MMTNKVSFPVQYTRARLSLEPLTFRSVDTSYFLLSSSCSPFIFWKLHSPFALWGRQPITLEDKNEWHISIQSIVTCVLLIFNSCPRDSTLQYTYQKSATQKFSFQSFKFRHVPSPRLYVHCDVVTCRSSDAGSVCDMGCKENTRRRRRESEPYIMDEDVFLSLGPVNFQDRTGKHSLCITVMNLSLNLSFVPLNSPATITLTAITLCNKHLSI